MTKSSEKNDRDPPSPKKKFYKTKTFKIILQICLTLIIFVAEAITGWYTNCLALLSDSFHTLSDVISLSIGLFAIRTSHRKAGEYSHRTFGYYRAEVLGGIIQAVFLYALCFNIYITAIRRFIQPEKLDHVELILIVGFIGLVVNLIGMFMFAEFGEHGHGHSHGGHSHSHSHSHTTTKKKSEEEIKLKETEPGLLESSALDVPEPQVTESHFSIFKGTDPEPIEAREAGNLNTRGIFLHIMGDTLGSVAVMVSAGLLKYFSSKSEDPWTDYPWLIYIDPSLTFLIATIIAVSTYPLLVTSMKILMEHAPEDINLEEFQKMIDEMVKEIGFKDCKVNLEQRVSLLRTISGNDVEDKGGLRKRNRNQSQDVNNNNSSDNRKTSKLPTVDQNNMLIHDLHIWQLSSTKRAATIHVVISRCKSEDDSKLLVKYLKIVKFLKREFQKKDIDTVTIQPEFITLPDAIEDICASENCKNCAGADCGTGLNGLEVASSSFQGLEDSDLNDLRSETVEGLPGLRFKSNLKSDSQQSSKVGFSSGKKILNRPTVVDIEDLGSVMRQKSNKSGNEKIKSVTTGLTIRHYP